MQNISPRGIWLLVRRKEYFLSYHDFPWFRGATVSDICDVRLICRNHLHWPRLDVDLDLECLEEPGRYPLVYQ